MSRWQQEGEKLYESTNTAANVDFEGINYFAAGIIRNDNPMRPAFVNAFNDFVIAFKEKLNA